MVEHLKFKKHELECFHADNSVFVCLQHTNTNRQHTNTNRPVMLDMT